MENMAHASILLALFYACVILVTRELMIVKVMAIQRAICQWTAHLFLLYADIDECELNIDNCDTIENSECMNTPGSYVCDCMPGYTKNGTSCIGNHSVKEATLMHSCILA